ncbi:hypothetical protein HRR83_007970 [Exophiala dermatitidis]|uniref:Phytanoyl-CoA dioxygenase n=1 Tax=Exophiala dermatitidis TaxID=5970 RepID=A0AAN6EUK9_EXODE|nr:hypothetical protein HRR75_008631 [Exophiala dermatitidis]KAJ4502722.1 hypothetical protein HRR73_009376 [Exophiala dermatitidis]KAJ4503260.1 hypothetical protein HRR74_009384 [Exophiala dermatitidis]KAJ4535829.1 hypothetical protein HRR77_007770 [Exophiala dermatitidis]KAJ4541928.1 hypothetical protein HRR78_007206 [Exophiala dermatitidis]
MAPSSTTASPSEAPVLQDNHHARPNGTNGSPGASILPRRRYSITHWPSLTSFQQLCSQTTDPKLYPHASTIVSNIPIYDLNTAFTSNDIDHLQDEWNHILLSGPGVFVLRNFEPDTDLLTRVNSVFSTIITSELQQTQSSTTSTKGDHFAASGKNARIWNSFQKHAEHDPPSFVQYYSNPWLSRVCESWLGPGYQVTAQVNIVKPGGKPQVSHRDYHLGFQTAESCARFPKAAQVASQFLTLQGAVAHSDMILESGPTRFLPFSQQFEQGYMTYRLPEFQEYFDKNWVSVALKMGDAVFFNPALVHAAGENLTEDVQRSANLLQVSSAFGRAMESVDTLKIIEKCWHDIMALRKKLLSQAGSGSGQSSEGEADADERLKAILAAVAEGYPFPTNLDKRPPAPGGMAPESEFDVLNTALAREWDTQRVVAAIRKLRDDSMP